MCTSNFLNFANTYASAECKKIEFRKQKLAPWALSSVFLEINIMSDVECNFNKTVSWGGSQWTLIRTLDYNITKELEIKKPNSIELHYMCIWFEKLIFLYKNKRSCTISKCCFLLWKSKYTEIEILFLLLSVDCKPHATEYVRMLRFWCDVLDMHVLDMPTATLFWGVQNQMTYRSQHIQLSIEWFR